MAKRAHDMAFAELEGIVETLGRYGGVTTSVDLRSEPLKTVGRALIARA